MNEGLGVKFRYERSDDVIRPNLKIRHTATEKNKLKLLQPHTSGDQTEAEQTEIQNSQRRTEGDRLAFIYSNHIW